MHARVKSHANCPAYENQAIRVIFQVYQAPQKVDFSTSGHVLTAPVCLPNLQNTVVFTLTSLLSSLQAGFAGVSWLLPRLISLSA